MRLLLAIYANTHSCKSQILTNTVVQKKPVPLPNPPKDRTNPAKIYPPFLVSLFPSSRQNDYARKGKSYDDISRQPKSRRPQPTSVCLLNNDLFAAEPRFRNPELWNGLQAILRAAQHRDRDKTESERTRGCRGRAAGRGNSRL
jgi:hypothetical protein